MGSKSIRPSHDVYEIVPATFRDTNADGQGDIRGITDNLEYIKKHGDDTVWLTPIFLSPKGPAGDNGYAVTDFTKIDPRFNSMAEDKGTPERRSEQAMQDFEDLIDQAHQKDLKVILDIPLCHTASDHEWFIKSVRREPGFENRYVWNDGINYKIPDTQQEIVITQQDSENDVRWKTRNSEYVMKYFKAKAFDANGILRLPPNNWLNCFYKPPDDPSAWKWNAERKQYYLHHFAETQPALDHNNPEARKLMLDVLEFWLKKGVDGFRLDALPYANYDPQLRDNGWANDQVNPMITGALPEWGNQKFEHSICQDTTWKKFVPEIMEVIEPYNRSRDENHKIFVMGENVAGPSLDPNSGNGDVEWAAKCLDPEKFAPKECKGKKGLDSCYTNAGVALLGHAKDGYPSADEVRNMLLRITKAAPEGGISVPFNNHDFSGTDRIDLCANSSEIKEQLFKLSATLPGDCITYYNADTDVPVQKDMKLLPSQRMDPSIHRRERLRPVKLWHSGKINGGFSDCKDPDKLVLPINQNHMPYAVDRQEAEHDSLLNVQRRVLQQKKQNPALIRGRTIVLDNEQGQPVIAFVRETDDQAVLCAFNMSGREAFCIPSATHALKNNKRLLDRLNLSNGVQVHIPPYGSAFIGLNPDKDKNADEIEVGLQSPAGYSRKESAAADTGQPEKPQIFAADLLIGDIHVDGNAVEEALERIRTKNANNPDEKYRIKRGEKSLLSEDDARALLQAYGPLADENRSAGGSTSCTLATVKAMAGEKVGVNLLGFAASDDNGKAITAFLNNSGVNAKGGWPEGIEPKTAFSVIVHHGDGKHTVLTCPGTEAQAFHKMRSQAAKPGSTKEFLDLHVQGDKAQGSNIIYLPESALEKFGVGYVNELFKWRWEKNKQMVITLPSHASFGPTDSKMFRDWIPSCNVVMGSDVEFYRIFCGREKERADITDQDIENIARQVQKGFLETEQKLEAKEMLTKEQVALITRGDKGAVLVTKHGYQYIDAAPIEESAIKNRLGAGNAAAAGFLYGYLDKNYSHRQSADLAMRLAAAKITQGSNKPYVENPARILEQAPKQPPWENRVATRNGHVRAIP